jgi:glycosyltransferase involved in cell wall biosynthesis
VLIASLCIPHVGGTYTVARNLRKGLKQHGISLRWIGVGPAGAQAMNDPAMASERAFGEVVAPTEEDLALQARALVAHLERQHYDGVLIDVLGGVLQANIARYLPQHLLRVLVVHNITPGTYAFARAVRDHVHLTIGVSNRIRDDLVRSHKFRPDATVAIPNPVDLTRFDGLQRPLDTVLRVVFLGRVEDSAKGVHWLPRILTRLNGVAARMTVAGDGPDLKDLETRFGQCGLSAKFTGFIDYDAVPNLLVTSDVLLMPSRHEGFGVTLIEAMAAGCVPVASRIRGVTDAIVEHGRTGLLFPIGGIRTAARSLVRLDTNRALLHQMSVDCQEAAKNRFSLDVVARTYAERFRSTNANRPQIVPPLDLDDWRLPTELTPRLRSRMPTWLKNFGRMWRGRLPWRPAG